VRDVIRNAVLATKIKTASTATADAAAVQVGLAERASMSKSEMREARCEKRDARSETREARREKRDARSEMRVEAYAPQVVFTKSAKHIYLFL